MSKVFREIRDLLAPNLQKTVCVVTSYPTVPDNEILPHVAEHLRYMAANENEILMSGPILKDGRLIGEGLTVLRTNNEVKAAAFMRNDPLIKRGLRRFEVKTWELREGTINLVTRISQSAFEIQ